MAEGTYEYEVMRAELLGVEKPDYDEFVRRQKENETKSAEEEEVEIESLKAAENQNDELKGASGKLDELNSLLSLTQRKINNFKFRCSSVTSYMKDRFGGTLPFSSSSVGNTGNEGVEGHSIAAPKTTSEQPENGETAPPSGGQRKSDLAKALDNHVDKLDNLLEKAEVAEISMQQQRKQMKAYLQ